MEDVNVSNVERGGQDGEKERATLQSSFNVVS
jgi:hypothetical protein